MAIDLKVATPDTSLPTTGFLFGADSQAASDPSIFGVQAVATTLLGSTSLTGATVTTSQPLLNLTQTWNAGAVTFTGLRLDVTDTSSAADSQLLALQRAGSDRFTVDKNGSIWVAQANGTTSFVRIGSQSYLVANNFNGDLCIGTGTATGNAVFFLDAGGNSLTVRTGGGFSWSNSASDPTTTKDLILARDAANTLAQRNGTNAQTFRLYNTFTDASNYERGFFRWASNRFEIGADAAGTGSHRVLRFYAGSGGGYLELDTNGNAFLVGGGGLDVAASINGNSFRVNSDSFYGSKDNNQIAYFVGGVATGGLENGGAFLKMGGRDITGFRSRFSLQGIVFLADVATGECLVKGSTAFASAATNIDGGHLRIEGGNGASGSAGDADGGDVYISGGIGYGTGDRGRIILENLPTSSSGLPTGALWNDTGTVKIVT